MANQYNHDIKHMMLTNAKLEKYNQYQLKETKSALQRQNEELSDTIRTAVIDT
ncbi:hypothetical protein GCM10023260_14510 [Bartonella acomydis]|uniref:Uncharacterized protein n=1 Tax=Bartonella acomydis TaxID=686234 RepID=A0ABP9MV04_9HYPH